jgi:fused signal recognition particle receptor
MFAKEREEPFLPQFLLLSEGVIADVLNRFFGQRSKEKPKQETETAQERVEQDAVPEQQVEQRRPEQPQQPEQRSNPFRNSLNRTRQIFSRMNDSFNQDEITANLWEELEEALLAADVGPSTSMLLIDNVRARVATEQLKTGSQVKQALREELVKLLGKPSPLHFAKDSQLSVFLVIGVNGSGKTTSIAKLAYRLTREGHRVTMAAGDTFRAAAIEQLKEWGERIAVPVISQSQNSDPGAVVYDAIQAATARGSDVLIVDTAGRLQTKYNLMEELKKLNKVIQKFVPQGPQELLIVMDATTGQNALLQARQFAADVGITGVIITKLDSTAKGGFAFAIADDLEVPIKFIGTGEKVEHLAPFDPHSFVAALFAQD